MTGLSFHTLIRALLFVAFCADLSQPFQGAMAAEAGPILLAHVAPTTGRFALHSESDRRGAEMAVDEFNARGGVLGRPILLISRNPTMDTAQAAQVAEDLISQTKVGFMVGAISSDIAASMSAVCQKHGVIFINTNSSAPSEAVEKAHRTKFVFDANAANYNHTLVKYALGQHASKRVLLLTEDDEWGRSSAKASRTYVSQYGGEVVGEVVTPPSLLDPAEVMKQVAAVQSDVVAVNISGDNQIKLFAQIDPKMLEQRSWIVGEVDWEELYPAPGTPRPLFGITWSWNFHTPGTAEFGTRYRERYGHTTLDYPGHVTHAAYLSTKALLAAIQKAGTTDNYAVIDQLEHFRSSAAERMQDDDAFMNPISHHLQQSTYIATWHPLTEHPERGLEVLGHITPEESFYEMEKTTKLESLAETPRYVP